MQSQNQNSQEQKDQNNQETKNYTDTKWPEIRMRNTFLPKIMYVKGNAGKRGAEQVIKAFVETRLLLDRISKPGRYSVMLDKLGIEHSSSIKIIPDITAVKAERELTKIMGSNYLNFQDQNGFTKFNYSTNLVGKGGGKKRKHIYKIVFTHLICPFEENIVDSIIEILVLEKVLISHACALELRLDSANDPIAPLVFNLNSYRGLLALTKFMIAGRINLDFDGTETDENTVKWMNYYWNLSREIGYDNTVILSSMYVPDPNQDEYYYISRHQLPFEVG